MKSRKCRDINDDNCMTRYPLNNNPIFYLSTLLYLSENILIHNLIIKIAYYARKFLPQFIFTLPEKMYGEVGKKLSVTVFNIKLYVIEK